MNVGKCAPGTGGGLPLDHDTIELLRASGFVIVPLAPTSEMQTAGAHLCYQAYNGDWSVALDDAARSYRAMVECGCL